MSRAGRPTGHDGEGRPGASDEQEGGRLARPGAEPGADRLGAEVEPAGLDLQGAQAPLGHQAAEPLQVEGEDVAHLEGRQAFQPLFGEGGRLRGGILSRSMVDLAESSVDKTALSSEINSEGSGATSG
jgi:hypothetical protein